MAAMREPHKGNVPAAIALRDCEQCSPGTLHLLNMDVASDQSVNAAVDAALEPGGFPTAFRSNMARAGDTDRMADYGNLTRRQQAMADDYTRRMAQADAPDPKQVADAIVALVQSPHGTRPVRTVVDPLMDGAGCKPINAAAARSQKKLFEQMKLTDLDLVRQ